jgi:hypothetical protein
MTETCLKNAQRHNNADTHWNDSVLIQGTTGQEGERTTEQKKRQPDEPVDTKS